MLLDEIEILLTSGGWTPGTDLFSGHLPSTPDTTLATFESGGLPPVHTMGNVAGQAAVSRPTLQVISRAPTYAVARANAQKAFLMLDGLPKRMLGGTQYYWGAARSEPFLMGKDGQDRYQVVCNFDIIKDVSTTS